MKPSCSGRATREPITSPARRLSSTGIATYTRLYPSFDGVLANGIKYGGSIEIRTNNNAAPSAQGSSPGTQGLYIQRAYVYMGADKFGKVLLGAAVQPSELFQTGNPVNFNTGGWDGDLPGVFTTGLPYFIDDDNDQANKIVYVSPQFSGFDFGASFEPNDYGNEYGKPLTRATSVDPAIAGPQYAKRVNTVDGAARYQGTFGPVGIKANIAGSYGGTVTSSNPAFLPTKEFTLLGGGVSATFAGFEVDGHIDSGKFGQDLQALQPGQQGTTSWIVGGSYTFGPFIVGGSYYGFDSGITQSYTTASGALHGYGIAAGGTYTLAPGASIFLEYLYGHQKANDFNLLTSTARLAPAQHHAGAGLRPRHRVQVVRA